MSGGKYDSRISRPSARKFRSIHDRATPMMPGADAGGAEVIGSRVCRNRRASNVIPSALTGARTPAMHARVSITAEVTMSDKVDGKTASPYGYPFWDWMAKEDPEYVRARGPLSTLSVGEGKELSIKHREMVIIGILAYRGREDGVVTHMRRAIQHGATKRELLEAIESAAVPGGGPTLSTGVQALMQLDHEGAFKK